MIKVLLVEDDFDLAATIIDYLEFESIVCDHAYNGTTGLSLAKEHDYNVILLDINIPGMNGFTLCETLRSGGYDTPVLMLTARDSLDDKLAGFNAGTDDYLVKPFEIEELLVRILALSKRRSSQSRKLRVGRVELDITAKQARVENRELKLTPVTFRLLEALMRASPEPVSQRALIQAIWGEESPDSNALRVHIHHLRKALASCGIENMIETIPGFGFAATQ
ncbi:MAG: response regulator transcription factor [Chromatiales bacterium]|jgi:DNA-binding response OmpR family regulator